MRKTNAYNNAKLCRMVVEDVLNENGIDLFVFDDLKKITDAKITYAHPKVLNKVIEYIWNGTDKLTAEVKLAIAFFNYEEDVNNDGLSFIMPPDGVVINDYSDVEEIEATENWDMLFKTCDPEEILKAIAYVWGTAGLDYFECSDDEEISEFECDKYEAVKGNPFTDSGERLNSAMWKECRSFNNPTTKTIVPYA